MSSLFAYHVFRLLLTNILRPSLSKIKVHAKLLASIVKFTTQKKILLRPEDDNDNYCRQNEVAVTTGCLQDTEMIIGQLEQCESS